MSDLEAMLRRELRAQWVAYDDARAQQMIDAATSSRMLGPRSYGAPLAAAAAVLAVTGTATAIAAHSGDSHGPVGGGAVSPLPSPPAPHVPSKPPRPTPTSTVPPTPSRVPLRPSPTVSSSRAH